VFHADVRVLEKVRLPVRRRQQFVREVTSVEQSTDASRRPLLMTQIIVGDVRGQRQIRFSERDGSLTLDGRHVARAGTGSLDR